MITWFDAVLVTLWAAVTVLGLRRGLAGGLWALGVFAVVLVVNFLPWPGFALALAVVLGFVTAWLAQRAFWAVPVAPWHLGVGAAGGFSVGFLVIAALALGLPVKVLGSQGTYPSNNLPGPLYHATFNSLIVEGVSGAWNAGVLVKRVVLPDQLR